MDHGLWIGLASALAGAVAGSVGTFVAQRRQSADDRTHGDSRALRDKVLQMEVRMAKVETELDVLGRYGLLRLEEGDRDV